MFCSDNFAELFISVEGTHAYAKETQTAVHFVLSRYTPLASSPRPCSLFQKPRSHRAPNSRRVYEACDKVCVCVLCIVCRCMADADSARTLYYNLVEASMLAAGQKRERSTIVMVSHCRPSLLCCMVIQPSALRRVWPWRRRLRP